jgi:tetratricopeptide (TPR) repeat protein
MANLQSKPKLDITDLLRRAVAHHQHRQLNEAEALYRQVLAVQPGNFDALHLCGVLLHQRGQAAEALKFIARALKTNSRSAAAHSNYGIVLAVLDRHEEALRSYERAVALKPDYAEALNNRGNTLRALKRNEDALVSFERAIAARPNYAEAINNRGNALVELGRCDEALASYERALERQPDYADAMINRGKCLILLKRSDEALASFDRALKYQPHNAAALKERGHLLRDRKQPAEALANLDQSLALAPDNAETHAGRALALLDLKHFSEAFIACDQALALSDRILDAQLAQTQHRQPHTKHLPGTNMTVRLRGEIKIFSERLHGNCRALLYAFSGTDHGCGWRASRKAKMVMRSARAVSALSRTRVMPVSFSGVPKQPQLMSMCKRYARVTTARNPTMIAVIAVAQIRKRQPISSSRPSTISTNGKVCATTCDASGEISLYDSTCCAKLEIFMEIENFRTNMGQRCMLGIKSLENPA